MKRFLSVLLALAMLVAFALPAMAAETVDPEKIPEGYPENKSHAYDMTYYVNGYGATPSRYQCDLDFGYENEDGGWVSWYQWYDISFGDPVVEEWPTQVGEYTVTIKQTATVYGTEYAFEIPMKITVLELPATSGKCGDTMNWSFDTSNDTLTISGTGDMYTVAADNDAFSMEQYTYEPGWWKLPVKNVIVEEGVENLSNYAFSGSYGTYETLQLPTTLKAIPTEGFIIPSAIKTLRIPEGITELGGWIIGNPGSSFGDLDHLYLPSTLKKLDAATVILASIAAGSRIEMPADFPTIHFAGTQEQWDAVEMVNSIHIAGASDVMDNAYVDAFIQSIYEKTTTELFADISVVFEPKEDVKEEITVENGAANVPDSSVKIEEGKDVVIDVTDMAEKAESVVIGSETVEKIADAETAVEIKLPDATVSFDKTAIGAVSQQAGTAAVTIVAKEVKEETLSDKQAAALKDQEVLVVLSLEAKAGETKITQFGGGKVTVSVPFELPQGKKGENFYVAYVAADGTITPMPTTYANGMLSFETTHFSNYVVLDNTANPKDGDNGFLLAVLLMVSTGTALVCTKRKIF